MGSRKRASGRVSPSGARARNPFYQLSTDRPRIMANAAAIQRLNDALANDATGEGAALKAKIIGRADELLDLKAEPPVEWRKDGVYDQGKEALQRLQYLGLAWLLERKNRHYVERAKLELAAVCGFPHWNPAHFLSTAILTHASAIGYDWFHDQLSADEQEACVNAILEKGLEPGLAQLRDPKARWPNRTYNWNLVCNAGLAIGALAVGTEPTGLAQEVLERCLYSVPSGLRGYSPDGSWDEGPGYWSFATEYTAYLLSALETAVGHDFGLGDLPGLCNAGRFRMHADGASRNSQGVRLFNFSDCEEFRGGSWSMRWLALRYDRPEYIRVPRKGKQRPMDLLWFSPTPPDADPLPRNALFRGGANIAMLRGSSSDESLVFRPWRRDKGYTVYVGIRAGANSLDNDHGQLDLGSFVLDAGDLRWAIDIEPSKAQPGYPSDYDLPGYFDMSKRFRYYRTATIGHNTLVINRQNQPLGVETEIVAFAATPELALAVVDLTAAYPDCLRVRRGFALIERQHVLIVDEVTPKHRIEVAWQMHTRAKATAGTTAQLTQPGGKSGTQQLFARVLEPAGVAFEIQAASVVQPGEAPNTGVCKLVATLPDFVKPARIAVHLSAESGPIALPEVLAGSLWSWIRWARQHHDPDARLS